MFVCVWWGVTSFDISVTLFHQPQRRLIRSFLTDKITSPAQRRVMQFLYIKKGVEAQLVNF